MSMSAIKRQSPIGAPHVRAGLCGALIVLLSGIAGCGYQQSGVYSEGTNSGYEWHSLYREDVQTVAVPVFVNRSFQKGIEVNLSKAVIQQVEARTPYKVASLDHADTVLEGEIISASTTAVSIDSSTALPQEQLFTIVVNFTWKNLRTGKVLVQRAKFDQKSSYFPSLGEGQFVGSQDAVEKLALGIVQEMQADW